MPTDPWVSQRSQVRRAVATTGLRQVEIARRMNVDPNHLNRMLSGKIDGPLASWVAVADVLGMTWQLVLVDPEESLLAWWVEQNLGITLEPWQAERLRSLMKDRV